MTTTTALQSLALFNNDFILRQSRYFAERLEKEAGADLAKQIHLAYASPSPANRPPRSSSSLPSSFKPTISSLFAGLCLTPTSLCMWTSLMAFALYF